MTQHQQTGQHLKTALLQPVLDLGHVAILLDIDGTLLDIAPRPQEVFVSEHLRTVLWRLCQRAAGALALISGRPLADIDRIFAPLILPAVGGHGAEIRPAPHGKTYLQRAMPLDAKLKRLFSEIAKLDPGIIVEDKNYSLALHYRLAPQWGGEVVKAVMAIRDRQGRDMLDILPGKAVIEVKPRGFDKGTALRELMSHPPFAGRRPIFVGDDTTDGAAFAVLPDFSGIGFSVGGTVPGASYNFGAPHDVRLWLEQLAGSTAAEAR